MNDTRTRSCTAAIREEIDEKRRNGPLRQIVVPPCPELLLRLRQAMDQPQVDMTEIGAIASCDVAMSASLIRKANSAAYAVGQPTRSTGQALTRLGLNTSVAVMTGFLASNAIQPDNRHLSRFWEQSSQRAAAMNRLAQQLPGLDPDLAQTCGLFLHVGLPVMLQSIKGYGSTMVEAQARRDRSFVETENANHRTDHAVVGALVARVWQLAPEVMATIRLHHDLNALSEAGIDPEVRSYMALALVADMLVRRCQSLPPDTDWQRHGAAALRWLEIDEDALATWRDQVEAALTEE